MIYMDYNAHAPLLDVARQAFLEGMALRGNPSSVHSFGRQSRKFLEKARSELAAYTGCNGNELVFTASATESNNQVLRTFINHNIKVFISAIEHDSVRQAARGATIIPVTSQGTVDLEKLQVLLHNEASLPFAVSVMAANNETGVIQPIKEIVALVRQAGGYIHVDATQAVGREPVHFKDWGVDYLTFSSHKIGGPIGIGALIVKEGRPLESLIQGGGQEKSRRAGTQNVAAAMGFAAAMEYMNKFDWQPIASLRKILEKELKTAVPTLEIVGEDVRRLPNTTCIRMPGVKSEVQVMAFDLEEIAVSAGSACSSGKVTVSPVLQAMGYSEQAAYETIRASLCPSATLEQIHHFKDIWLRIYLQAARKPQAA